MAEKEPWEIHTDEERTEGSLTTFIIFCEDEISEPIYFRSFSNEHVQINEIPNQRSARLNLNSAIEKCEKEGLVIWKEKTYVKADGIKQHIWCVYDRDLESADLTQIRPADHINFTTAITQAEGIGMQVAWSNDCFELWILLHFEDVPMDTAFNRDYIYDRLTAIFKALPDQSAELTKLTQHPTFNYKEVFKKKAKFISHVLPLLHPRQQNAIDRAKVLENFHGILKAYHDRNPCTMVHQLVQSIIQAGGKS